METDVVPYLDDWKAKKSYPFHLHKLLYKAGMQSAIFRFVTEEFGGPPPRKYDAFHELIVWDELSRVSLNAITFMLGIDSMAVPPIAAYGPAHLKKAILPGVISGELHVALAISEPTAGSDVANIKTSATRVSVDGKDYFLVNGEKKWITGGTMCDYYTTVVRTGGTGMGGISILVIPKSLKGVKARVMEAQFDSVLRTAFVTFDDVLVPIENLIGSENSGFKVIMENFNHERFVIAAGASRGARRCLELSLNYSMKRKTFGKRLIDHGAIRQKLGEMARHVESMHAQVEQVAHMLNSHSSVPPKVIGQLCALMKVNCTKGFEFCAREASQIFGGAAIVKEGQGREIESLYRDVRAQAIPGGSEEILLDLSIKSLISRI